ncbi:Tll0287-like domain-containing protein [Thiohalomonas denitrificans]|uniref:Tll0287-like domain-containing protein n=1 Tax=Thiohalomonas denitrificans TaxID=415747 RepID=A0A1G5PR05_9GAMM|nr:DUF3365 domain-containing protein [Thiohalomonas denitrificans]SCZ52085.1 Protein of unknown function [Thiohalomonas denitrificans]
MKRAFGAALLCCLPFSTTIAEDHTGELAGESKVIIKQFMGDLKGELKSAMKAGGPVNAIGVCNRVAPAIAKKHTDDSGWSVARTSLKLRNPDNAPDAWEQGVLEKFEARKAAGEPVKPMAYHETVEEDGQKVFRFMKAIPTGEVCLKCHGAELSPAVADKLDELYPSDEARGFQAGDIRGAFTLKKPL